MGLAPEKASRIYGRDTQTTCPDPWSNGSAKLELAIYYGEPNRISRLKISGGVTLDLGSELVKRVPGHFWAISESVIPTGMTR